MLLTLRLLTALAMLVLGSACSGARADRSTPADSGGRLVMTGSSTVAPLMAEAAARFERSHPDVRVDVQSGGSSRGIADVREATADIGMVSRELLAEERDLTALTIAHDAVGVVVHRDNPTSGLSVARLRDIYLGRIRNWRVLGGPDLQIVVVNKAAGRATLQVFADFLGLEPSALRADVIIGENEQAVKMVLANRGALAYVSIGAVKRHVTRGAGIKSVTVDGIAPDRESLSSGLYPIQRPLNLVVAGEPAALASRFLDYLGSGAVDDLIDDFDFVAPRR